MKKFIIVYNMNIFIRSPNNTTSRKYLFSNPLKLDPNRQYEIALLSCNFNLNYINISAALGNSTFKYSSNNGTLYKTAFLEDGFYSLQELNNEINNILTTNGDNPNGIYFSPLTQSSKMRVVLFTNYRWDATVGLLYQILGFNNQIYIVTSPSINIPLLNLGIESVYIGTNLTKYKCALNNYNDNFLNTNNYIFQSQLLLIPSANIPITNPYPTYTTLQTYDEIQYINISVNDQNDNPINYKSLELHLFIREKK